MVPAALLLLASSVDGDGPLPAGSRVEAAPGKGVTFTSGNGDLVVQARARVQFRFTGESQGVHHGAPPPDTEFVIRRMRLVVRAELWRTWEMLVQLGVSNQDMEPDLRIPTRDAYVLWKQFRDVRVRGGQMKVPFGRQRVVSSGSQQMVDRSEAVAELNLDRDVGVVAYSDDVLGLGQRFSYAMGIFGGDGRNRVGSPDGLMLAGRVQFAPFGDTGGLNEPDFERRPGLRAAVGLSAAYNRNTNRARSTFGDTFAGGGRVDHAHGALDLVVKGWGLSFSSELLARAADRANAEGTRDGQVVLTPTRSGWGYHVQAAALVTPHVEFSLRYGGVHRLPSPTRGEVQSAIRDTRELGGGASVYVLEHNLKFQVDAFQVWREDLPRGEQRIRAQVQFLL